MTTALLLRTDGTTHVRRNIEGDKAAVTELLGGRDSVCMGMVYPDDIQRFADKHGSPLNRSEARGGSSRSSTSADSLRTSSRPI